MKNQTTIEIAMQMVIMDAIEKGHINAAELIEYMQSEVFTKSVNEYAAMIETI